MEATREKRVDNQFEPGRLASVLGGDAGWPRLPVKIFLRGITHRSGWRRRNHGSFALDSLHGYSVSIAECLPAV